MKISTRTRDWLSLKEAAEYLSVSASTVRRLREALDPFTRQPFLISYKPTPHLVLISTASLEAHRKAAQDLEFWDRRHLSRGTVRAPRSEGRCDPRSHARRRGRRNN